MIRFSEKLSCWKLLTVKSYQMNDKSSCFKPKSCTPSPLKKFTPKISLYFQKWDFLALIIIIKKFFSKESFSYISGNGTLYFSTQAQKIKKSSTRKFLIFQETELSELKKWKKPNLKMFFMH